MKVFFSLCNGTLCFHFYRLEKGVAKGKVFQAEIGNFWVIRARDIYFVGGKRCFSPNSCRGIVKNISLEICWNGKFRNSTPGNVLKRSHFPGTNSISRAGIVVIDQPTNIVYNITKWNPHKKNWSLLTMNYLCFQNYVMSKNKKKTAFKTIPE